MSAAELGPIPRSLCVICVEPTVRCVQSHFRSTDDPLGMLFGLASLNHHVGLAPRLLPSDSIPSGDRLRSPANERKSCAAYIILGGSTMKRLLVLGSLLAIAACASQPPPPAVTAPAPVPQVAAVPPSAPPPPPPPPASRTRAFDGAYTGSMTLSASGLSTRESNASGCVEERPAKMTILNGYVYIQYSDWKRHVLHYRGNVKSDGWVHAYHTNRDGSRSVLSGQINSDTLTANMERGPCDYTATLAKK